MSEKSKKIAELNDAFRKSFIGGKVMITAGINALGPILLIRISDAVKAFDDFNEDNDPYGEHDFGALDVSQVGKVFWKIDYYAPDLTHGSEDPSDPSQTTRVLTIMLPEEY